jgi:hypothetical protein
MQFTDRGGRVADPLTGEQVFRVPCPRHKRGRGFSPTVFLIPRESPRWQREPVPAATGRKKDKAGEISQQE